MTRAAWLVPARDGGPGTHEPGSGPGEATPDQELVRRGQRGDLEAFDELMGRHVICAYHVALAVLHDHHDAQDTVQDAFLAAWRGLAGFRGDCEFGTWLHPIVTRLALNKASRRRYTVSLDQVSPTAGTYAGPAETAERAAAARSLRAAVRTLPAAQRSAITLHYLDGLPCARIAALTRTTIPDAADTKPATSMPINARHADASPDLPPPQLGLQRAQSPCCQPLVPSPSPRSRLP